MTSTPLTSTSGDHSDLLSADVPMQVQIYRQLRAEVLDGLWFGRDDFPGEKDVAERFAVSLITARNALERLAAEGYVDRGRGRRGRAVFTPSENKPLVAHFFPAVAGVWSAKYRLVNSGVDIAPAEACRAFDMPSGSRLWQAVRTVRLSLDGLAVTHNVQRPELGERHSRRDLGSKPMAAILRAEGVEVARVRRRIQATTPPPVIARQLGLNLDSPVLMVVLRLEDEQGRTVEWMRAFSHPDRPLSEEVLDIATGSWHSTDA
ncbi:GntR family transcriptional regulator [Streptomyces sp. NPDC090499]|uniref:GntR family transcriptional regulator n=1 Tax=Streptomyces sp. NPDC090499 TaxID=3365965 RepID=UPI00382418C8